MPALWVEAAVPEEASRWLPRRRNLAEAAVPEGASRWLPRR